MIFALCQQPDYKHLIHWTMLIELLTMLSTTPSASWSIHNIMQIWSCSANSMHLGDNQIFSFLIYFDCTVPQNRQNKLNGLMIRCWVNNFSSISGPNFQSHLVILTYPTCQLCKKINLILYLPFENETNMNTRYSRVALFCDFRKFYHRASF